MGMSTRRALLTLLLAGGMLPGAEPLFQAIQKADNAAVKRLLDGGASPNAKDADGNPALMLAALWGGPDSVKLLLDRGADPNVANAAGATPLMWAIPNFAKVKLLVEHGANVNARSTNLERTPLLVASSFPGTVEILQLLLSKGADIHAKDKSGMHAWGGAAAGLRAPLSTDHRVLDVQGFEDPAGSADGRVSLGTAGTHRKVDRAG